MNELLLDIVTPEGKIFSDRIKSVQLPGSDGELEVLVGHAPLVTLLKAGVIEITYLNNKKELVAVNWGYLKVDNSKVIVLADGAVCIGGSSESLIAKSLKKAKKLIEAMGSDSPAYALTISRIDEHARTK